MDFSQNMHAMEMSHSNRPFDTFKHFIYLRGETKCKKKKKMFLIKLDARNKSNSFGLSLQFK